MKLLIRLLPSRLLLIRLFGSRLFPSRLFELASAAHLLAPFACIGWPGLPPAAGGEPPAPAPSPVDAPPTGEWLAKPCAPPAADGGDSEEFGEISLPRPVE